MSTAALPCRPPSRQLQARSTGRCFPAAAQARPVLPPALAGTSVGGGNGASSRGGGGGGRRMLRVQAVAQPFGRVVADPLVTQAEGATSRELFDAYFRLFRGWNALPSLALVLLGAWIGAGKTVHALQHATVWFMGFASGAVALASCAINDYFDWQLDAVNDNSKPIPSGLIAPDRALLYACLVYICLLAGACIVPNAGVRLIIAASAATTVFYTPLLKKYMLIKNFAVATTIAAAPLAGAVAAGAAGPGLQAVLAPCTFLWLGIMHREIMMDIQDRQGDGAAGVHTLPVAVGPRAALAVCVALLAACLALAAHAALFGGGLAWAGAAHPALQPVLRAAALAAVGWTLLTPAAAALAVLRSGFGKPEVSHAITVGMSSVGLGTVLLAILA